MSHRILTGLNLSSENLWCRLHNLFVKYLKYPIICSTRFGCVTVKTFTIHHLVTENTSETFKFQSVLNVDNCFREKKLLLISDYNMLHMKGYV